MPFESNTETGRISVMKGSRRVLVKVVLFQLRERSQPKNDATPNFFANYKRPILGLSNRTLIQFAIEKVRPYDVLIISPIFDYFFYLI